LFLKTVLSDIKRNSAGRLFHVTGPANEKARSPNLVFRRRSHISQVNLDSIINEKIGTAAECFADKDDDEQITEKQQTDKREYKQLTV